MALADFGFIPLFLEDREKSSALLNLNHADGSLDYERFLLQSRAPGKIVWNSLDFEVGDHYLPTLLKSFCMNVYKKLLFAEHHTFL